MGKAGKALKQVLEEHEISQYSIAKALGIARGSIYRWVRELRDPTAETVVEIVRVIRDINPIAAEEFVQLYLGDVAQGKESIDPQVDTVPGAQSDTVPGALRDRSPD